FVLFMFSVMEKKKELKYVCVFRSHVSILQITRSLSNILVCRVKKIYYMYNTLSMESYFLLDEIVRRKQSNFYINVVFALTSSYGISILVYDDISKFFFFDYGINEITAVEINAHATPSLDRSRQEHSVSVWAHVLSTRQFAVRTGLICDTGGQA
ncbi:hypothetical protein ACJX0J_013812, partial [Zea mays]